MRAGRAAAVAAVACLGLLGAGCASLVGAGALAVTATAVPPVVGLTALPLQPNTTHMTLSGGSVAGSTGHPGGWGVALDTASVSTGYIAHGHVELGRYGRDGFYGYSGAEAGVGVGGGGYGVGLLAGYGYGGMPQNGHQVPLRLMGFAAVGPVHFRLSGYVGWRFGVHHEYPHSTADVGPGWNTFGADLDVITVVKGDRGGLGVVGSIGIDRQDDINTEWFKLGLGVAIGE
jgi:hypothetical protein